jgi:F0F1-type ATP synthase membrane subunit c/vacuolar-type H+-ATPase subunit K
LKGGKKMGVALGAGLAVSIAGIGGGIGMGVAKNEMIPISAMITHSVTTRWSTGIGPM